MLRLSLAACALPFLWLGGCKPSTGSFDAGCNQAIAGPTDGGIVQNCAWTGACNSNALKAAINQAFGDAGQCKLDTDCEFYTDGGQYVFGGVEYYPESPVNVANAEGLEDQLESIICGYNDTCEDGGDETQLLDLPGLVTQGDTCLQCYSGQCVANEIVTDAGD